MIYEWFVWPFEIFLLKINNFLYHILATHSYIVKNRQPKTSMMKKTEER